jgi:hypothetical protein
LEQEVLHFTHQKLFGIGVFAPQTFLEIVNFASQTHFGIENCTFFFPPFFGTVNFAFSSPKLCLK